MQQIYQGLYPGNESFQVSTVRRIGNVSEALHFLRSLEDQSRWSHKYVVLDCTAEMAKEIVVSHVRDISLGKRTYHYLLSGLVRNVFVNILKIMKFEHNKFWTPEFGYPKIDKIYFTIIEYFFTNRVACY